MKGKYLFGIILIIIGAGFLLDQFNVISFGSIFSLYWPMILIIVGLLGLFDKKSSKFGNAILIVLGIMFQINSLDIVDVNVFSLILPVILILIGVNILFSKRKSLFHGKRNELIYESKDSGSEFSKNIDLDNEIDVSAFMSGIETNNRSQQFRGGRATAIMGGIDIDLRGASLYEDIAELEITVIMGAVEIMVPDNWRVEVSGTPLLGSVENKSGYNINANSPILRVKGFALMGSIEIK